MLENRIEYSRSSIWKPGHTSCRLWDRFTASIYTRTSEREKPSRQYRACQKQWKCGSKDCRQPFLAGNQPLRLIFFV